MKAGRHGGADKRRVWLAPSPTISWLWVNMKERSVQTTARCLDSAAARRSTDCWKIAAEAQKASKPGGVENGQAQLAPSAVIIRRWVNMED